jgi:hypothetical protein
MMEVDDEYPGFNSLDKRIKSFSTFRWPHPTDMDSEFCATPLTLAYAGFFLDPRGKLTDRCVCFSCGLALVGWEPADDPVTEHRTHGKKCAYIKTIPDVQGVPTSILARLASGSGGSTSSIASSILNSLGGGPSASKKHKSEHRKGGDRGDGDEDFAMEKVRPPTLIDQAKAKQEAWRKKLMAEKAYREVDESLVSEIGPQKMAEYKKLFLHDNLMSTLMKKPEDLSDKCQERQESQEDTMETTPED